MRYLCAAWKHAWINQCFTLLSMLFSIIFNPTSVLSNRGRHYIIISSAASITWGCLCLHELVSIKSLSHSPSFFSLLSLSAYIMVAWFTFHNTRKQVNIILYAHSSNIANNVHVLYTNEVSHTQAVKQLHCFYSLLLFPESRKWYSWETPTCAKSHAHIPCSPP